MKFSVVMPVYLIKKEHISVINETIQSVKKYSNDYELLIVDDGSPISTFYLHKEADKTVRHGKNLGIATSWNDGIRMSRGDFIAVINDDIVVPEGWLEGTAKCFEQPECGVAAPSVEHLPDLPSGIHEKKTWFPGSCFMLSQETIKQIGYFDEQFSPFNCEDIDYWERLTIEGLKMYRNFDIFVRHKEGNVLHDLDYKTVDNENVKKLIAKWGYDPRAQFYGWGGGDLYA